MTLNDIHLNNRIFIEPVLDYLASQNLGYLLATLCGTCSLFIILDLSFATIFNFKGIFLFSFIWSVGATTDAEGRNGFNKLLRAIMDGILTEALKTEFCITDCDLPLSRTIAVPIPHIADVFSWRFVKEEMGR